MTACARQRDESSHDPSICGSYFLNLEMTSSNSPIPQTQWSLDYKW
jgi:hypothetical protein